MLIPSALVLDTTSQPFDHPDWIFEIKHDGFRALAVLDGPTAQFVSRQGHRLTAFGELGQFMGCLLSGTQVILDGELALPDASGRTVFADLMARRNAAHYFAFDVLMLNGKDLRTRSLVERKKILKSLLSQPSSRVHYVDHLAEHGTALFRLACQHDLEGIVAKRADSPYAMSGRKSPWRKIKNPDYSQREGRGDWFDKAKVRLSDPTGRRHVPIRAGRKKAGKRRA
jgi:bifunctional non-homologous end joining protein LigD